MTHGVSGSLSGHPDHTQVHSPPSLWSICQVRGTPSPVYFRMVHGPFGQTLRELPDKLRENSYACSLKHKLAVSDNLWLK
jgi:hypothetical protein